ncbi:MAG TPA: universal stress protein [Arenibacter sp.]|nr:universal stress protein [Arenibacter sp.]|tara:strand:+ start:23559 stop:24404 length:846 start_codon:yes stop_codon:yes gene_type:complete
MKKIILPTDFSESAYNAIRYAIHLHEDMETTFYLLHTYTPPIFQVEYVFQSPSQSGLDDLYQTRAMKQLEALKQRLQDEFAISKHIFKMRAAFNTLTDEIILITKNENVDLVIMGTQGITKAKEILFGTNTTQVIKKTLCPVIAVPSNFMYRIPTAILFPTDYEIDYNRGNLQQLLNISKKYGATIDVIHISSGYDLTEEQLRNKQKLKDILVPTYILNDLPDQGVIKGINQFQSKKAMDLLVMVRNKHTFFERMFVEPIIKKIGFHIEIPFMVIPLIDKK